MTFHGKTERLPADWTQRRVKVLTRDGHICQARSDVCVIIGHEVDHIIPRAAGGSHDIDNLRAICNPCHKIKSQQEAQQARGVGALRKRPTVEHPGVA